MDEVSLIDRLSAFLPKLRAANDELEKKRVADPESVDIEHVDDPDAQHIEMVNYNCPCCVWSCRDSTLHSHSRRTWRVDYLR